MTTEQLNRLDQCLSVIERRRLVARWLLIGLGALGLAALACACQTQADKDRAEGFRILETGEFETLK